MTDRLCRDYPFTLLEAQLMTQRGMFHEMLPGVETKPHHHKPAQKALPVEPEILPPEMPLPGIGVLFEDQDVAQALKIYEASCLNDRKAAMREVLMFALRIAAINLDVH